ncbi:Reverse transcriptase domain [Lasallia pustulata]|uniref:Reverse transcriptase domain n=1 Tax=Lasallia pustulata TaxID=136370 RepID=A0A1W5D962_9LECA|nr:Reverse transcriptase domain [Lasallia pustulata]
MIRCTTDLSLDQSSDHLPIITEITLGCVPAPETTRRVWHEADSERIRHFLKDRLPLSPPLTNPQEIDMAVEQVTKLLHEAIDKYIPVARPSQFARPGWTRECKGLTLEARRLRRIWQHTRLDEDHQRYLETARAKQAAIRGGSLLWFRNRIAEAFEPKDLWKLANWARSNGDKPKGLPQLPDIRDGTGWATTNESKARVFTRQFFPPPRATNLSDMESCQYLPPLSISNDVTADDIRTELRKLKPDKAPGPDNIPNKVLKLAQEELTPLLTAITQACYSVGYHPKSCKDAVTVVLKKPNKDYREAKSYRPIALLNTLGKVIESVIAKRIQEALEEHRLLPDAQMGARPNRSTVTALELLTEQIHTVWKEGRRQVATALGLDISGAFDHVSHQRLLHNLRVLRMPTWIVTYVTSFLTNRSTSLRFNGYTSEVREVNSGLFQGSKLSPILFIMFQHELPRICEDIRLRSSVIGFVDDTTILTYGETTERNCEALRRIHDRCLDWADRHGAVFAPAKYDLIHFTRTPKHFNMGASIRLGNQEIAPKVTARVLGAQLDQKLKYVQHVNFIQEQAASTERAIARLAGSTWGVSMLDMRKLYLAISRAKIVYGSQVWHPPPGQKGGKARQMRLERLQNRFLRRITGAYRATKVEVLQNEAHIPPLDIYMDKLALDYQDRNRGSTGNEIIESACRRIRNKLQARRGRTKPPAKTPKRLKVRWKDDLASAFAKENWSDEYLKTEWRRRWSNYTSTIEGVKSPAAEADCSKQVLKIHKGLHRATSTLATLFRTEEVGFRAFLYKRKVPGYDDPNCGCGLGPQTARHVVMECPHNEEGRLRLFREAGETTYSKILSTGRGIRALARWAFSQEGHLLKQFSLMGRIALTSE